MRGCCVLLPQDNGIVGDDRSICRISFSHGNSGTGAEGERQVNRQDFFQSFRASGFTLHHCKHIHTHNCIRRAEEYANMEREKAKLAEKHVQDVCLHDETEVRATAHV